MTAAKVSKKWSLARKLRANLQKGKKCYISFEKIDGTTTSRWVMSVSSSGYLKKTDAAPNEATICFFCLKSKGLKCCTADSLLSVQTGKQYYRAEARRERYREISEMMSYYSISFREAMNYDFDEYVSDKNSDDSCNDLEDHGYGAFCYGPSY